MSAPKIVELDSVNRRLLHLLDRNARMSTAQLARSVNMSAPAVRERIQALESAGVIRGYRLDLDPEAFGLTMSAWVRVRPSPGELGNTARLLQRMPEVMEAHRVTGEDCFIVRIIAPTIQGLEALLDQLLVHGTTNSAIVVSTVVAPRSVLSAGPAEPSAKAGLEARPR
ncbi:Lrp/AsnC family transcriptional regulator [Microbacterium oxydans]|uniref:Lrp/AsnC family transcriptional regulator n=1 Tax=Microbacterium oxydans TaxID=82380 RepID=UPI003637D4F8